MQRHQWGSYDKRKGAGIQKSNTHILTNLNAFQNGEGKHKNNRLPAPTKQLSRKTKHHSRIQANNTTITPMNKEALFRLSGTLLALSAVLLGAFGAHALKDILQERGSSATWETAVRYQMWHALALILISLLNQKPPIRPITGYCLIAGTLLFSGSLYGLALGGPIWLGPITPLGGLCLIIGWGLLALSSMRHEAQ
jgi:uncharacterized membrane protein YgdD (TMEM256/DUF423 family)